MSEDGFGKLKAEYSCLSRRGEADLSGRSTKATALGW